MHDTIIIGAGAAGLMAAIFAARGGAKVLLLDSAAKVGAKILISGGGRCNVTHDVVGPDAFYGASRNAIAKVLRTFNVEETIRFFEDLGVELKREETGKLFPVTDRARTILDALVAETRRAGAELRTGTRVTSVERKETGFVISAADQRFEGRRVILATGGRSVPKTGSDGFGYELARSLGHTVTETFPALVPLLFPRQHWMTALTGASVDAVMELRSGSGKVIHRDRGSFLFTHFGASGPLVLDISRHWIEARRIDPGALLYLNVLAGQSAKSLDATLLDEEKRNPRATIGSILRGLVADRVIDAFSSSAGVPAATPVSKLTREQRRAVVSAFTSCPLPVVADRGFDFAEVTAGGVPLTEVDTARMASRVCAGLYLCGEILDVDGRIGGYNFQWAWATGRLAGLAATK